MTEILNLFPMRIPIGRWRDPVTGKDIPVNMSPEFERAMAGLFRRIGGAAALSNDEIAILTAGPDGAAGVARVDARVAELELRVAALQGQIAAASRLVGRLEALEKAATAGNDAAVAQLANRASYLEYGASVVPVTYLDWTRPGKIGSSTPNTGKFSTLQATGAFACNGAAVQTSAASGGAVSTTAATNAAPWGYTTQAQADGIRVLLNNIRSALVANGIMS